MKPVVANGSVYKSKMFEVDNQRWVVCQVTGRFNYINVVRLTDNPKREGSKDFKDWEAAINHFACPKIRAGILYAKKEINTH